MFKNTLDKKYFLCYNKSNIADGRKTDGGIYG